MHHLALHHFHLSRFSSMRITHKYVRATPILISFVEQNKTKAKRFALCMTIRRNAELAMSNSAIR